GTITSVQYMTRDAIRRFIARYFVPGNMVLGVVGGISRRALQRAVARAFSSNGAGRRAVPPRPGVRRTGMLRMRRRHFPQSYVVRLIAAPSRPRDVLALSMAIEIIGADPDARLFQGIRE